MVRNLLRAADFLPAFHVAGLISMIASQDFKRLGVLAAHTLVVHVDRAPPPAHASDVAPVPVPVALTLDDQRAILDYAERVGTWTDDRAQELAGIVPGLHGVRDGGRPAVQRLLGMAQWLRGRR
jgi:hypothetical protein